MIMVDYHSQLTSLLANLDAHNTDGIGISWARDLAPGGQGHAAPHVAENLGEVMSHYTEDESRLRS